MIEKIFDLKLYIPKYCYLTIYEIPFLKLYQEGKRSVFIDIDNTMISYDLAKPTKAVKDLFSHLKEMGYEIIILSNNRRKRVKLVADELGVSYFYKTRKPLKGGFKKALKLTKYSKEEIITVGDQIMTDILGSNRVGLDAILVRCLKRSSEKWYTKLNRRREKNILKGLEKNYPTEYKKIIEVRGKD